MLYELVVTNGWWIRAHRFFIAESSSAQTDLLAPRDSFSTRIEVVETDDGATSTEVCDAPTCFSFQSSTQTIVSVAGQSIPNNNSLPFSV